MDKYQLLAELKTLLHYHQETGIPFYPKGDDCQAFLRFFPEPLAEQSAAALPEKTSVGQVTVRNTGRQPEKSPLSLLDIADEVAVCRACDLHRQRIYPVAGRGLDKVRLLLVGDWLAGGSQGQLSPGLLFGVEQDLMLARMLAAIKLPTDSVFVTNVIKCAIPEILQPQAEHVQSCISFLRRQISVLMPELICTMGMVAARAVLESSLPLSRLRGRLHEYDVGGDARIPVITTYHPTYLLQNAEMKTAAWTDLQLVARTLRLPGA